ncbi:MAG: hypothetical protein J5758_02040 [Abditibacteriota bacterium]|nr:hypothetical protein [Abditibacteriota bacterium]
MTMQIKDTVYWKGERYDLASHLGLLPDGWWDKPFHPEGFGIKPKYIMTCCWKGYTATYRVKDNRLYVANWIIHSTEDGNYPPVKGVEPIPGRGNVFRDSECSPPCITFLDRGGLGDGARYDNLNIPMDITGVIILGKGCKPKRSTRPAGPDCYSLTYELTFEKGVLVGTKETSGTYEDPHAGDKERRKKSVQLLKEYLNTYLER